MEKGRHSKFEIELISTTPYALETLLYTKSSRMGQDLTFQDIINLDDNIKMDHLNYMFNTIQSAFEFVDYTFRIKNVSRAFTHQLVRTRDASYQQETMRAVDVRDGNCLMAIDDPLFIEAIETAYTNYGKLIDKGYPIQDSRGILPTAAQTGIFFKANLRTLSRMSELRLCKRTAGEYQNVFKDIIAIIKSKHHWAAPLLKVACAKTGICAFPNYKKCPVQKHTVKISQITKDVIEQVWANSNHVANPVAKNGKTM